MKRVFFIISLCAMLVGCSSDKIVFDGEPNIYFQSQKTEFSWFGKTDQSFALDIACNIVGQAPSSDKNYRVEVVKDKTTAIEGVHYEQLPEVMKWEKGKFNILIPVVILNGDPQLLNREFTLTLELKSSEDMGVNYEGNLQHCITISGQVAKPVYWDQYTLSAFFGEYSKVKHAIIVQLTGRDFPASSKDYKAEAAYWQNIGLTLIKDYFVENPGIKDENGIVIAPW